MTKLMVAFGNFADAPNGCVQGGQFFVLSKASKECEPSTAMSGSLAIISVGNLAVYVRCLALCFRTQYYFTHTNMRVTA